MKRVIKLAAPWPVSRWSAKHAIGKGLLRQKRKPAQLVSLVIAVCER